MTADRAALVEKVARAICKEDGREPDSLDPWMGEHQHPAWEDYEDQATAAIALIRAEVLEEAARAADEQAKVFRDEAHDQKVWGNGAMSKRALSIANFFLQHAAAVRALKEKV